MATKPIRRKQPNYWVVLREGFPPVELEFLQQLTGAVKMKSGQKLRALRCTKIQSENYFLCVEIIHPADDARLELRIPYGLVLTIVGEEKGGRAPGFLSELESE